MDYSSDFKPVEEDPEEDLEEDAEENPEEEPSEEEEELSTLANSPPAGLYIDLPSEVEEDEKNYLKEKQYELKCFNEFDSLNMADALAEEAIELARSLMAQKVFTYATGKLKTKGEWITKLKETNHDQHRLTKVDLETPLSGREITEKVFREKASRNSFNGYIFRQHYDEKRRRYRAHKELYPLLNMWGIRYMLEHGQAMTVGFIALEYVGKGQHTSFLLAHFLISDNTRCERPEPRKRVCISSAHSLSSLVVEEVYGFRRRVLLNQWCGDPLRKSRCAYRGEVMAVVVREVQRAAYPAVKTKASIDDVRGGGSEVGPSSSLRSLLVFQWWGIGRVGELPPPHRWLPPRGSPRPSFLKFLLGSLKWLEVCDGNPHELVKVVPGLESVKQLQVPHVYLFETTIISTMDLDGCDMWICGLLTSGLEQGASCSSGELLLKQRFVLTSSLNIGGGVAQEAYVVTKQRTLNLGNTYTSCYCLERILGGGIFEHVHQRRTPFSDGKRFSCYCVGTGVQLLTKGIYQRKFYSLSNNYIEPKDIWGKREDDLEVLRIHLLKLTINFELRLMQGNKSMVQDGRNVGGSRSGNVGVRTEEGMIITGSSENHKRVELLDEEQVVCLLQGNRLSNVDDVVDISNVSNDLAPISGGNQRENCLDNSVNKTKRYGNKKANWLQQYLSRPKGFGKASGKTIADIGYVQWRPQE
ncbi:hypothetical protein Tco_0116533 [Tanacetum coccineum]